MRSTNNKGAPSENSEGAPFFICKLGEEKISENFFRGIDKSGKAEYNKYKKLHKSGETEKLIFNPAPRARAV